MTKSDFSNLPLSAELLQNLSTLGYKEMTSIQQQSLPLILQGQDVIAQGKTGSGKTAAFGLGLLQRLEVKKFRVQSLVLCPTRELADQVANEIRSLARAIHNIKVLTLCGGMPFGAQIGSLEHGAHIVVGTPGRIMDHLEKQRLDLSHLQTLVLDEADKMLDMGFQDAIEEVISFAPKQRQTLLFSATYPKQIQTIASNVMREPQMVKVESTHDTSSIEQLFFKVENKEAALQLLLMHYQPESCVIFCNTKQDTKDVTDYLWDSGFSAIALHGDLEQRDREQTLIRFANKSASILVATDVASRGLDIDNVTMVINYQIAFDPEVHVHRIGRTGRAGNTGIACSLFQAKDSNLVCQVEDYLDITVEESELPSKEALAKPMYAPNKVTLRIDGGKKQKVRAGDILGALTSNQGIQGSQVGKINLLDHSAYVAIDTEVAKVALKLLEKGKIKGRSFRVWRS